MHIRYDCPFELTVGRYAIEKGKNYTTNVLNLREQFKNIIITIGHFAMENV